MPPVQPRVSFTISEAEKSALERLAKRLDRPVSWVVRDAVRKRLDAEEEKPARTKK